MTVYVKRREMSDDELMHWKYIKKIRKNGKWHYFYDDSELKKYENNLTTTTVMQDDSDAERRTTTKYRQSNKLLNHISGRTHSGSVGNGRHVTHYEISEITKTQGKLDREYAKAERFVYDKVYSKNSFTQNVINNGRDWLNRKLSIK